MSAIDGLKRLNFSDVPKLQAKTGIPALKTYEQLSTRQLEARLFLYDNPYSALWMDMGLGKTITILTLLVELLRSREMRRGLIVAPLRVAVQTWPDEIVGWKHTAGTDFTLIRPTGNEPEIAEARARSREGCRLLGLTAEHRLNVVNRAVTKAEERIRRRLAQSETPIHIINRERLPWLVWYWGKHWPYDTIVFDESSGLRSHKSERFIAMNRIRKNVKRMYQLTGTPAPEGYIDLFPQIYLLDQGKRLGRNITAYRDRYFVYDENKRKWFPKNGAADQITAKVHDIVLVIKDEVDPHAPLLLDRPVTLSDAEMEQYREFEQTFILELPGDVEIEAETAGALAQKLLQLSSGAVYDAEHKYHVIHDHKIAELRQIQEEAQGSPLLVAYWHKPSLARLKKAFPEASQMDRAGNLTAPWNAGKIPMLLIHPMSAGHGLNLQTGPGHILVFFDIPFPLESYLQTIKRIARQGQKKLVRVYHISARGTVDEGVVPRLKRKESAQDYLFTRIKALRKAA